MCDADRPFDLSRRHFIGSTLSAMSAVLLPPGCGSQENSPSPQVTVPAAPSTTSSSPLADAARPVVINADVPGSLVFPESERAGLVRLTTGQRNPSQATITFQDSHGRTVTLDSSASFAEEIRRRGKAGRESVVPKVLAAYILDATWQVMRREGGELRRDFARLQEQAVLDNISVGAVVAFLESIAQQRGAMISHVTWDERDKRIVASFV
jgi:hypothetical protein